MELGVKLIIFFKYVVCYYVYRLLSIKYRAQTHDLLIVSPLPLPLDHDSLPLFGWIGSGNFINNLFEVTSFILNKFFDGTRFLMEQVF
jgi:hypothetical protein